jgi:hypothetical protein
MQCYEDAEEIVEYVGPCPEADPLKVASILFYFPALDHYSQKITRLVK